MTIQIQSSLHDKVLSIYIYKNGCMFVYMFGHNSITPERFQPNLVHIYYIMYVYIIYIFYLLSIIFSREDGVGGLHGIHPQGLSIAAVVTFTQIGIEATAR
jgi:hypothetical protein